MEEQIQNFIQQYIFTKMLRGVILGELSASYWQMPMPKWPMPIVKRGEQKTVPQLCVGFGSGIGTNFADLCWVLGTSRIARGWGWHGQVLARILTSHRIPGFCSQNSTEKPID